MMTGMTTMIVAIVAAIVVTMMDGGGSVTVLPVTTMMMTMTTIDIPRQDPMFMPGLAPGIFIDGTHEWGQKIDDAGELSFGIRIVR